MENERQYALSNPRFASDPGRFRRQVAALEPRPDCVSPPRNRRVPFDDLPAFGRVAQATNRHSRSDRADACAGCLPSATAPVPSRISGLAPRGREAVRKHRQRFDIVTSRLSRTERRQVIDLKLFNRRVCRADPNWHSNCFYSGRPIDFGARAKRSLAGDVNAFTARQAALWHAKSGPPARDGSRQEK